MCSAIRVICSCDHCDLAFCALQLTALIKHNWCILLYYCAGLYPNTILMQAGGLQYQIKQSVISVAFKTIPETRLRICIYKTSLLHRPDDYIGFTPRCPPHFTTKLRLRLSWKYDKCFRFRIAYLHFSFDVAECVISRDEHEYYGDTIRHWFLFKRWDPRKIVPQGL